MELHEEIKVSRDIPRVKRGELRKSYNGMSPKEIDELLKKHWKMVAVAKYETYGIIGNNLFIVSRHRGSKDVCITFEYVYLLDRLKKNR